MGDILKFASLTKAFLLNIDEMSEVMFDTKSVSFDYTNNNLWIH